MVLLFIICNYLYGLLIEVCFLSANWLLIFLLRKPNSFPFESPSTYLLGFVEGFRGVLFFVNLLYLITELGKGSAFFLSALEVEYASILIFSGA